MRVLRVHDHFVECHQEVVVDERGRLGRGLGGAHSGVAERGGHRAGGAAGGIPVGDGRHVARRGGAVQFGNVEDRFVRGDLRVPKHSPDRVGQQFGHPGVDDGVRNIGGSHGLPGKVQGDHAVVG